MPKAFWKSKFKKFKVDFNFRNLLFFVLAFAVVGTIALIATHAATPAVNIEAENSTVSGPATAGSDANASNGSYVLFKVAAVGCNAAIPAYGCYVTPSTAGFIGDPNTLTQYSWANKAVPNASFAWQSSGLYLTYTGCSNVTIDHAWIRAALYVTPRDPSVGCSPIITITNSVIDARWSTDTWVWHGTTGVVAAGYNPQAFLGLGYLDVAKDGINDYKGSLVISNSAVIGTSDDADKSASIRSWDALSVNNVEAAGGAQGITPSDGAVITKAYVHMIRQNSTNTAHLDGIFLVSANNVTIQQSYITDVDVYPSLRTSVHSGTTAGIFLQDTGGTGPMTGNKFYANYNDMWGSVGNSLYNQDGVSVDIINNEFSAGAGYTCYPTNYPARGTLGTHTGNKHTDGSLVSIPATCGGGNL